MTQVNRVTSLKARIGAGTVGLFLAASMQIAWAAEPQSGYVMTVIANEAEGQKMIAGDYAEAIAVITAPNSRQRYFSSSNNLCVAYTKTSDLSSAAGACSDALRASRTMAGALYDSHRARSDRAVALSNRGVLRAINGDIEGARSDFRQSVRLNDRLTAAEANLARLDRQEAQTVSSL